MTKSRALNRAQATGSAPLLIAGIMLRRVANGAPGRGRSDSPRVPRRGASTPPHSFAVCQALFANPSPVLSPAFWSLIQVYRGLPLYAHCLLPSSRVTIVQSPLAVAPAVAISGGQFVAQGPLHALLPAASLSNV